MKVKLSYRPIAKVLFQPRVGRHYAKRVPRLLVLGMSHYAGETDRSKPEYFTNAVIGDWSKARHTRKFFTNIIATCIGYLPTYEEQVEFWDSVEFYNYIEEFVGNSSRQPHPYELWPRSEPAFAEVLDRLKPQLVLVIGELNWRNIPNLNGWM